MSYKEDFESRSTLINTYGNNALLLYALELRFEIADIFAVASDALTDGGEDKKCEHIIFTYSLARAIDIYKLDLQTKGEERTEAF